VYAITPIVSTIKNIVEKAAAQNKYLKQDFDHVIEICRLITKNSNDLVSAVRNVVEEKEIVPKKASESAIAISKNVQELSAIYKQNGGIPELTRAMISLSDNVSKTAEGLNSLKEIKKEQPKPNVPKFTSSSDLPRRNNLLERLIAETKVVEARRKLQAATEALKRFTEKK